MRMPVRSLPERPDLTQYRKQAKELVKAHAAGDAAALIRIRAHHPRLAGLDDAALRRARFALADAQWVIAREHGVESWPAFTAAIADRIAAADGSVPHAAPAEPWRLAEDAVVRGDDETLAAVLRDHGDALRRGVPSAWWGGLAPRYTEDDARAIIAREHFFADWEGYAAHAAARRDPGSPTARFEAAVDAVVDGDLDALTRALREDPALVRARSMRIHHATLLHYVAANGVEGFRQRTPKNVVAIAAALLDAGADVDATADIYGGGAQTLGLAATSIHPVTAGVLEPLLAFLLARGAAVGEARGGAAWSALINGCHANGRPAAAEFLAARAADAGADLDLEAAAGVGRLDVVRRFFADGALAGATPAQARDGFTWACEYGRAGVVAFLLARGQEVDARLPRHHGQTGLHWAAWGGHAETVRVLLAAGARVDIRDERFDGTALGWALHAWAGGGPAPADERYVAVVRQLRAAGATLDLDWLDAGRRQPSFADALRDAPAMRSALGLDHP
jgi:ankyrin repeat protein